MGILKKKTPLALRLKRLHAATGQTWDALATALGIKRAMIFHAVAGRRGFSEKTLQRLAEYEVRAGLRSQASVLIAQGLSGTELIDALLNADEPVRSGVTVEDIDAGTKDVALEYRRGSPPSGFPTRVRVTAAKNATIWQILGENSTRQNPANFLIACLPELRDRPEVLERLTPHCYAQILDTALDLTFGLNWRSQIQSSTSRGVERKKTSSP